MPVIIVDIDGTLLNGSSGIKKTIDYVNSQKATHDIYIVSGRNKSEDAATRAALARHGISYDRLYLNPSSTSQTLVHKKIIAQKLMSREHVVLAIDNNENMRRMYESLGIKAVSPTQLSYKE
jgi:ribonucleotide monophosphatase NagD (HAD superfamily)